MIDSVYQVLETIINKELRGHVVPAEFNLIAKQVQDEIYRGYFEDYNRDANKENKGLSNTSYADLLFNQRERIEQFNKTAILTFSIPNFVLPADLYLLKPNGIDATGIVVEEAKAKNINYLSASLAASSTTFPTYERVGASTIKVSPATIVSGVTCRYLRQPLDPNWTYTVVSGTELFNQGDVNYQDFEVHPGEFSNIVIRMLSYFGINIRETEIAQYAEAMKENQTLREER